MPEHCGAEKSLPLHSSTPTATPTDTPTDTPTSTPVYSKRLRLEAVENVECMDTETQTQAQADSTPMPADCVSGDVAGVQDIRR